MFPEQTGLQPNEHFPRGVGSHRLLCSLLQKTRLSVCLSVCVSVVTVSPLRELQSHLAPSYRMGREDEWHNQQNTGVSCRADPWPWRAEHRHVLSILDNPEPVLTATRPALLLKKCAIWTKILTAAWPIESCQTPLAIF